MVPYLARVSSASGWFAVTRREDGKRAVIAPVRHPSHPAAPSFPLFFFTSAAVRLHPLPSRVFSGGGCCLARGVETGRHLDPEVNADVDDPRADPIHRSVKRDVFAAIYEHMVHGRARCVDVFRECASMHVEETEEAHADVSEPQAVSGQQPRPHGTPTSARKKRAAVRRAVHVPGKMVLDKRRLERFLRMLMPDIKRSEVNYVHAMVDANEDGVVRHQPRPVRLALDSCSPEPPRIKWNHLTSVEGLSAFPVVVYRLSPGVEHPSDSPNRRAVFRGPRLGIERRARRDHSPRSRHTFEPPPRESALKNE